MDEINSFDLHAAWVRRSEADLQAFLEGLATRLEQSLPGHVEVNRQRESLLHARRHVASITIRTDNGHYMLAAKSGDVHTARQHEVRGVVVRTETLPLADWLAALEADLKRISGTLASASGVLHDFLTS
ncbi:MAG: hypothetical protein ACYCXG_05635 [Acidiferrobacter sp.]